MSQRWSNVSASASLSGYDNNSRQTRQASARSTDDEPEGTTGLAVRAVPHATDIDANVRVSCALPNRTGRLVCPSTELTPGGPAEAGPSGAGSTSESDATSVALALGVLPMEASQIVTFCDTGLGRRE
jgi:hypothetical protein